MTGRKKKKKLSQKAGAMPEHDMSPTGSGVVASGVIFYERLHDRTIQKCPSGQYFFQADAAGLVRRLVVQATRHLGHRVPSVSVFNRAELFYRDDALTGIRVDGEYAMGMDCGGEIEKADWSTPEVPKFTLRDGHCIVMDPSDEGVAHVAVLNMSFGALVKWDLSTQYGRGELTAGDLTRPCYMFFFPEEVNLDADEFSSVHVPDTAAIRRMVRRLDAESLHMAFLPKPPVGSGKLLIVKASDDHRMLLYIADRAWVEYELARTYAMSQAISREELEKYAAEGDWTLEEAKVLWARQGFSEQAVFVREGVESIHELNDKALWGVFETTLGSSVYEAAFANWVPLRSVKKNKPDAMMKPVIRQETNNLKKSLGVRGRGRSKRTIKERTEMFARREREIRVAVMKICESAKSSGANVVAAEDMVTPPAVAEEMGMHATTIYRWLGACGLDFGQIRRDCLRRVFSRK